jgi:hypothetical protein
MLGTHKATSLASTLFEVGVLSGSGTQLHSGDYYNALAVAFVGCVCVIMITGTVILAEVIKARVRRNLRKQDEEHKPPDDSGKT